MDVSVTKSYARSFVLACLILLAAGPARATDYEVFPGVNSTPLNSPPGGWTSSWTALHDRDTGVVLTDVSTDRVGNPENNLYGTVANPLAYWSQSSSYLFFRVRLAYDSSGTPDIPADFNNDAFWVLIDNNDDRCPDYSFAWDTQNVTTAGNARHGLEFNMAPVTSWGTWGAVAMDDRDGSNGNKLPPDLNTLSGHTQDGFLRLVTATDDPTTTFLDYAVSLDYIVAVSAYAGSPALTSGLPAITADPWHLAFVSADTSTDHAQFSTLTRADIAGRDGAFDTVTLGNNVPANQTWTEGITVLVPEPSMALLGLAAASLLAARRGPRRRPAR